MKYILQRMYIKRATKWDICWYFANELFMLISLPFWWFLVFKIYDIFFDYDDFYKSLGCIISSSLIYGWMQEFFEHRNIYQISNLEVKNLCILSESLLQSQHLIRKIVLIWTECKIKYVLKVIKQVMDPKRFNNLTYVVLMLKMLFKFNNWIVLIIDVICYLLILSSIFVFFKCRNYLLKYFVTLFDLRCQKKELLILYDFIKFSLTYIQPIHYVETYKLFNLFQRNVYSNFIPIDDNELYKCLLYDVYLEEQDIAKYNDIVNKMYKRYLDEKENVQQEAIFE